MQNLQKILVKSLNLKPEETTKFILLFFHSFFVGLFIAFYFVQANSVFISNYSSEQLPIAYMIAGIVGYFTSWLYSFFQKRVKSKFLFLGALAFMFLITVAGRIGFGIVDAKHLSFFVFIWAWPFISLVGIESGGLALKLLNLIQVKRMFGLVNMGGVSASIIGYLLIPLLTKIIGTSYNLLFGAAFSLVGAMVLLYFIYKKFPDEEKLKSASSKETKTGFKYLLKQKYFKLIFLSATLSMTVIYIADFGFLSGVKIQKDLFPTASDIAGFFALVFAGLKIGELFISYFSSRFLSKYGVKLGLTIMPITLTLLMIAATFVGFTAGVLSISFLALMVLTKSMERILRRGLDDPAFNILYQPLPKEQQLSVQAKVGIVMQFAIAIAGGLLFLLNFVLKLGGGFKLEFYPVFFLPILVIWVIVAWNLYLAYKNKLREILRDLSKEKQREASKYQYGTEVLTKKFKKFNDNVVNLAVTILAETNPRIFEPYVSSLLKKDDELIQKAIMRSIDPTWRQRIIKQTKVIQEKTQSEEIKALAADVNYLLDFTEIKDVSEDDISALIDSRERRDKVKLIKYLTKNSKVKEKEKIILHLLKQKEKAIKSAAIRLAVGLKTDKIIQKLIFLLRSPIYYHISTAALLDIGEKTLPYLKEMFEKAKEKDILMKIIEIYAKMGSTPAKTLLVNQLNYPDREIQLAIIWALYYCKYQATEEHEITIIKQKIIDITGIFVWLLASIRDIEEEKNTLKLFLALDQEKVNNYEQIFNLLSFLHEPRVVNLIKKNIIGKNTIYALELIDNFIQPDLKPYIIPVFDDITVNARIKKLSKYFPQKAMSFRKRLQAIIMQDYDKHDTWTIAKTLEMIEKVQRIKTKNENLTKGQMNYDDIKLWTKENTKPVLNHIKRSELPDEVFLCLFHSNELVYSTASKVIFEENPAKCFEYLKNMSPEKNELVNTLDTKGFLLMDKVKLLKRYQLFFTIPDFLLVRLAQLIRPIIMQAGERLYFNNRGSEDIIILIRGSLIQGEGTENELVFSKKIIITPGINISKDTKYLTVGKKATVLIVDRHKYFNLLVDNTEILQHIFEIIQK